MIRTPHAAGAPHIPREWLHPPSFEAAAATQRELARRVVAEDAFGEVHRVGGVDISHAFRDPAALVHAAVVVLDWPTLGVSQRGGASVPGDFPYVPGFLGFRECPSLVAAWASLAGPPPELVFVDGHGLSHPRAFGIACHFGVLLDVPAVGVAKTILVGEPAGPLGPEPGDRVPLVWRGSTIGMVLRTKRRANPVYVSVGHRISLATAVDWVLRCVRGYRLPEPTRQAHLAANELRRTHTPPSAVMHRP